MNWSYWTCWVLSRSVARAMFGVRVIGRDKLVTDGPVLIAANHESFLDPPLIGIVYPQAIHFLARKTLFRGLPGVIFRSWNAVPVDQERPDMTSLKTIVRCLRGGDKVLVFPEGQRTLDGTLGPAQPGIGLIVAKAGVPVQPVRIRGAREALPRGGRRLRLARISVTIGEPLRFSAEELAAARGRDAYQRIAERIMAAIEAL
jgi:1-acyl-sn-glycerol-3-phosphate acyltransferase